MQYATSEYPAYTQTRHRHMKLGGTQTCWRRCSATTKLKPPGVIVPAAGATSRRAELELRLQKVARLRLRVALLVLAPDLQRGARVLHRRVDARLDDAAAEQPLGHVLQRHRLRFAVRQLIQAVQLRQVVHVHDVHHFDAGQLL